MKTVTWTTTRRIIPSEPFELPERIKTRHGYQLLRIPDILRVNGRLYMSKRSMDKLRRHIAERMLVRIDTMARTAILAGLPK